VAIEETLNDLYVEKSWDERVEETAIRLSPTSPNDIDPWKKIPFRTSAGTKLTGTTTRNILKMFFWYFVLPSPFFDEAEL